MTKIKHPDFDVNPDGKNFKVNQGMKVLLHFHGHQLTVEILEQLVNLETMNPVDGYTGKIIEFDDAPSLYENLCKECKFKFLSSHVFGIL